MPSSASATSYSVVLTKPAQDDFAKLDKSIQKEAVSRLEKLQTSPLYGDELGNKNGMDLTGCRSLHFHKNRFRIVYTVDEPAKRVVVQVFGKREGSAVYRAASTRLSDIDIQLGAAGVRVSGKARFPQVACAPPANRPAKRS